MNGPDETRIEEPMDEFELAMQRAMQRVDAPETLIAFLTAATEVKRESVLPWRQRTHKFAFYLPRPQAWMGGAIAALLTIGVFTAGQVHERREKARELANQQFAESMRITDKAMEHAREQLRRAGIDLDQ